MSSQHNQCCKRLVALFKETTKSYFTHYSCVVIILFNTGLCRSTFSTISFGKLFFHLSVLASIFFKSNALNQDIKMCVIMLCNFVK